MSDRQAFAEELYPQALLFTSCVTGFLCGVGGDLLSLRQYHVDH